MATKRNLRIASDIRQISTKVERLVAGVFPSRGIVNAPRLIDVSEDDPSIWFHFSVTLDPVNTEYLHTFSGSPIISVPTKFAFPVTPRYLQSLVEDVLESIFKDPHEINIGDYPVRKVSYVHPDDKRMGDKPIAYFDQRTFRFDFRINVETESAIFGK